MKLEDFHKLDKKIITSSVFYDQIDVSYILRNHIISTYRNNNNLGHKEVSLNKSVIYRLIKSIINTFFNIFKKREIWVFSSSERRKKIDGHYYDRVASIVSEDRDNVIFIENPVLVEHKYPTKDIILSDAIFFLGSFIFSFFYFKEKKLDIDKDLLNELAKNGITLDFNSKIKRFIGQYKFMQFFLKKIYKPELVFSVYPNGYYGYNYAFKEYGIPIVELQHGIIYSLHPSYNSILKDKDKLFKPDYIFTYGIKDKMTVSELNYVPENNCFVVGSYGLWKAKKDKSDVSEYMRNKILSDSKTLVVIATVNDLQELYDFCVELEKVDRSLNILLLPRYRITDLQDTKKVKVLDVDKTNIFETYKVADFLLTKVSTSALEALFMGIPTFILDKDDSSIFIKNYSYINSFNYIKSPKDIVLLISKNKFTIPSKEDVEQVFAINVPDNFNKYLKSLTVR